MTFSVAGFVRHTSPDLLRLYCESREVNLPDSICWTGKLAEIRKTIIETVHNLRPEIRRRITRDWERVSELTDEVGRDSMIRAFRDDRAEVLEEFKRHESSHDRALWLFVRREKDFKRAEEIAYARFYQGNKRYWNGFVVPQALPIHCEATRVERFASAVGQVYGNLDGSGDYTDIDIYGHEASDVTQLLVYVAELKDVAIEFDGPRLTSRERQLAREAAILYSGRTGSLDIIAPGGSAVRASLARLFVAHLLESERPVEQISLRQYQLRSLRALRGFPVDPDDRIYAVEVRALRLEPRDGRGGRLLIEKTPRQPLSLYSRLGQWFRGADAVPGDFDVIGARITVTFMASGGTGAGRPLTFDIAEPNACTLKDHTCRERLVAEKYLERWRLVALAEEYDPASSLIRAS